MRRAVVMGKSAVGRRFIRAVESMEGLEHANYPWIVNSWDDCRQSKNTSAFPSVLQPSDGTSLNRSSGASSNVQLAPFQQSPYSAFSRHFSAGTLRPMSTFGSSTASAGLSADQQRSNVNRILYRSRMRGYLELDLLLGKWAEQNIGHLDEATLNDLVSLLDEENPDLWKWLTGQVEPSPEVAGNRVFMSLRQEVAASLDAKAHPATRAQPGAPWVRGWDDRDKKPMGGPPAGNQ
eukprot:TRINITY_DN23963_c0_g1_i1.p1 TRINITY_DN23963_c0_g1~~TRINITY_DN23963_c0_g1_i1.p1  ORF type:complete len:235 (-),score=33.14 TRINITY_DN23963_c0_g1_i1:75-779(-)